MFHNNPAIAHITCILKRVIRAMSKVPEARLAPKRREGTKVCLKTLSMPCKWRQVS